MSDGLSLRNARSINNDLRIVRACMARSTDSNLSFTPDIMFLCDLLSYNWLSTQQIQKVVARRLAYDDSLMDDITPNCHLMTVP